MENFPEVDSTEKPRGFGGTPDPEPETNEDGSVNASEEEQMQYDLLTVRARKMIFGRKKNEVLKLLGAADSPAESMGRTGALLLKGLIDAAASKGMKINSDVGTEAGAEIVEDLNELGKSAGVFTYDDKESEVKEVEDALLWGVKFYGEAMQSGKQLTPELQKEAQVLTVEGLAEEQGQSPQKKPNAIADGVSQAMAPQQGLVGGSMAGSVPPAAGGMPTGGI
jgi:hypothetical protein